MSDEGQPEVISAHEAYSKRMAMARLGISQKFWDKMLDEGLPFTVVGQTRWVTGADLIQHFSSKSERKRRSWHFNSKGNPDAEKARDWKHSALPESPAAEIGQERLRAQVLLPDSAEEDSTKLRDS